MADAPIKGRVLFVSDLHLTDSPADAYRFDLLNRLPEIGAEYKCNNLAILGDLTDLKDRHRGEFVTRVIDQVVGLSKSFGDIIILKGNHDYVDPKFPFFGFLDRIKGYGNISYVSKPRTFQTANGKLILCVPHMHDAEEGLPALIQSLDAKTIQNTSAVFTHHTFSGCKVENGMTLDKGLPSNFFEAAGFRCSVISGDIHVPQKLGRYLEYVGSPYHVHFGDSFRPRALFWEGTNTTGTIDLSGYSPRRHRLDLTGDENWEALDLARGDQVKIRLHLPKAEMVDWVKYKEMLKGLCEEHGIELFGIEVKGLNGGQVTKRKRLSGRQVLDLPDDEVLDHYSKREKIDGDLLEYGKDLIHASQRPKAP